MSYLKNDGSLKNDAFDANATERYTLDKKAHAISAFMKSLEKEARGSTSSTDSRSKWSSSEFIKDLLASVEKVEETSREQFSAINRHLSEVELIIKMVDGKVAKIRDGPQDSVETLVEKVKDAVQPSLFDLINRRIDVIEQNLPRQPVQQGELNKANSTPNLNPIGNNDEDAIRYEEGAPIAMMTPGEDSWGQVKVRVYTGDGTIPFSVFTRKLEDYMETRQSSGKTLTPKDKVGILKLHLDGIPRDLVEQVPAGERMITLKSRPSFSKIWNPLEARVFRG